MTVRYTLVVCLLTSFVGHAVWGQQKVHVYDSSKVMYDHFDEAIGIDSTIQVHPMVGVDKNKTVCQPIEVYFDKQFTKLAYQSVITNDSCLTYDYWRNGQLKQRRVYLLNDKGWPGIPVFLQYSAYCANGQLIEDIPAPGSRADKYLVTVYYCNGNKRFEFHQQHSVVDGKMTEWHEDGRVKSVRHYKNGELIDTK